MAKIGLGARPKPSRAQPERSAKPLSEPSRPPSAPDPELFARKEKLRREFQTRFGKNLRAARLEARLKQSDVAKQTGLLNNTCL